MVFHCQAKTACTGLVQYRQIWPANGRGLMIFSYLICYLCVWTETWGKVDYPAAV